MLYILDDSRNSPIAVVFHLQKSPPVTLATLDHGRRQSVQVIVFSVNRLLGDDTNKVSSLLMNTVIGNFS